MKHIHCFSYRPKTSLFQKTNRQKTDLSQNQSSGEYPFQEQQKIHLRKPNWTQVKLNTALLNTQCLNFQISSPWSAQTLQNLLSTLPPRLPLPPCGFQAILILPQLLSLRLSFPRKHLKLSDHNCIARVQGMLCRRSFFSCIAERAYPVGDPVSALGTLARTSRLVTAVMCQPFF